MVEDKVDKIVAANYFCDASTAVNKAATYLEENATKLRVQEMTRRQFNDEREVIVDTLVELLNVREREKFNSTFLTEYSFITAITAFNELMVKVYQHPVEKLTFTFFNGNMMIARNFYWATSGKARPTETKVKPTPKPTVATKPTVAPKVKPYTPPPRPATKAQPKNTEYKPVSPIVKGIMILTAVICVLIAIGNAISKMELTVMHVVGGLFMLGVVYWLWLDHTMTPSQREAKADRDFEESKRERRRKDNVFADEMHYRQQGMDGADAHRLAEYNHRK